MMGQWNPWQEMAQESPQEPNQEKKNDNRARNKLVVEALKISTERSGVAISAILVLSIILLYPKISVAKMIYEIEDKEMVSMSAWQYSKSFLSSKAWFSFFKDRKLSPEFHRYISIPASLMIGTGLITFLSTSKFYEGIFQGQQLILENIQQEILNSNVLCEKKLSTANFLCETKLLEKVNLCKNRFTKSNLSWAELVFQKGIEFDTIITETQKLCKMKTE